MMKSGKDLNSPLTPKLVILPMMTLLKKMRKEKTVKSLRPALANLNRRPNHRLNHRLKLKL